MHQRRSSVVWIGEMLAAGQGGGEDVTLHLGLGQAERVRTMSGGAISYILRKVNTRRIDMGQSATLRLGCCARVADRAGRVRAETDTVRSN
jgi:hypothetical protein